jgi:hypothetical protein
MLDQARLPDFELTLTQNRETSGLPGLQRAGLHNFPFLAVLFDVTADKQAALPVWLHGRLPRRDLPL